MFDVSHMGEIETPGPEALASCSVLLTNDVERAARSAARSTALLLPRGRRRARRPLHLPPGGRPLPDGHQRRQPREGPRLVPARTPSGFDVEVVDRHGRLRDARRPGPARARDRAGDRERPAARAHDGRRAHASTAPRRSSAAPATPARTASSCCSRPSTPSRSGTRCCGAARARRARRARHAAHRGLLPALRQRAQRPSAGRSRRASAGAASEDTRLHRRRGRRARVAPPGPPSKLAPFALDRRGVARAGRRGRRRRRRHERHLLAEPRGRHRDGLRARRRGRSRAPRSRSTSAGASARRVVDASRCSLSVDAADSREGATVHDRHARRGPMRWRRVLSRGPAVPPRARLGPDRRRRRDVRDHLVRPGRARRGRLLRAAGGRHAVTQNEPYAEVESVKAVSDVIAPLSGEIDRGQRARSATTPEAINEDPYGEGWMVRVRLSDPAEQDGLLDRDAYVALLLTPPALEPLHRRHRRRSRGDARGDRRRQRRGAVRRDPGRRAARAPARPARGLGEAEVYAHLRELAARNRQRRGRDLVPRRRDVRPLRPGGDRHAHGAARSS